MKRVLFRTLGYLFCILPAAVAVLSYFPLWLDDRAQTLSVLGILLLFTALLPFRRTVKEKWRTPSAWGIWFFLWIALSLFRAIIDQLITVALIGFPTGLVGAFFFRLSEKKPRAAKEKDGGGER